jgi:UDP-GlcNAc3NAcA epimerase
MIPLKLAAIVGARPQFIKAAPVSRAIARHNAACPEQAIAEVLVHTGQHYDYGMSAVFFHELGLPEPAHHLGVGSGPHGAQTGQMLKCVEAVLLAEKPDLVLVYGDTNSTLAGALAAAKLHIPVAHIEAGLRSFNQRMPEEVNRVLTDHLATWLFCPSEQAVQNLAQEGLRKGVHLVGDVMYDVLLWHLPRARERQSILTEWGLHPGSYALATLHRAESTDDPQRLRSIFMALERLARHDFPVVLPLHPRTGNALGTIGIVPERVHAVPPVSYEEMLCLEAHARVILTDSGGLQKEAYWLGVPCVTLREETEWVETVIAGWNVLVGYDPDCAVEAARKARPNGSHPFLYGDGNSAERIVRGLVEEGKQRYGQPAAAKPRYSHRGQSAMGER